MTIQEKINSLREELNAHNYNYYVLDNAIISDFDFDIKLKELEKLGALKDGKLVENKSIPESVGYE